MLAHCGLGLDASLRLGAFWSAWPQLRAGEHLRVGHGGRSERICASWGGPPQEFGNVEPVIGGWRGFADLVDVDAVVTDKNGPQHSALFLVTNRAPGRRLALWRGLGGSLRFLDLAFEPGDLDVTLANLGLQFFDASPQALGFGSAVSADVVARHLLRNRQFPGPGHASLLRMGFAG